MIEGQRVALRSPTPGQLGTVTSVSLDGLDATVQWDSGAVGKIATTKLLASASASSPAPAPSRPQELMLASIERVAREAWFEAEREWAIDLTHAEARFGAWWERRVTASLNRLLDELEG